MKTLFRTHNAKKATFVAVLTFAFALAFISLDSRTGYSPFYRHPLPKVEYKTIEETEIPITDADFERLISHIGCDESALKAGQETGVIQRYKKRSHRLSNNEFLSLLQEDNSLTEKQISCALMAYSYRNNATVHPLKSLTQSEFEALKAGTMDAPKARLLFGDAIDEERKGTTEAAKLRLKFLIDNEYVRQHEPAIKILAEVEYRALLPINEQ